MPIVACNGLPNLIMLSACYLSACSNLGSFLKVWRYFPASRPARGPGDVSGILIDSADSVVRVFGPLPALAPAAPRSEADTRECLNGHSPPVQPFPNLRAHVFSDDLTKPDHSDVCSMRDCCGPHDCPFSHKTAILGAAIDSIHWLLHVCRHSSLVVPCTGRASLGAVCNHAAATACGSVALAEDL